VWADLSLPQGEMPKAERVTRFAGFFTCYFLNLKTLGEMPKAERVNDFARH